RGLQRDRAVEGRLGEAEFAGLGVAVAEVDQRGDVEWVTRDRRQLVGPGGGDLTARQRAIPVRQRSLSVSECEGTGGRRLLGPQRLPLGPADDERERGRGGRGGRRGL